MTEQKTVWSELAKLYERKLSEKLAEVVSSERFSKGLQTLLSTSEEFRKAVIKGVEVAMSNLELPTGADFEKMYRKMESLDEALFDVRSKLHDIGRGGAGQGVEGRLKEIESKLARIQALLEEKHGGGLVLPQTRGQAKKGKAKAE